MEAKEKAEALRSIYESIRDVSHEYNIPEIHRTNIERKVRSLYNSMQEDINLKTTSEQAAIESQKKQFEEMDKMIRDLKKWNEDYDKKLTELRLAEFDKDNEILRLKGKIKEAHDWGCTIGIAKEESWEQFSKENLKPNPPKE